MRFGEEGGSSLRNEYGLAFDELVIKPLKHSQESDENKEYREVQSSHLVRPGGHLSSWFACVCSEAG